jgi:hypothetical protein
VAGERACSAWSTGGHLPPQKDLPPLRWSVHIRATRVRQAVRVHDACVSGSRAGGWGTAMKKWRIVLIGLALGDREWLLNDGQIQNPSAQSQIAAQSTIALRGVLDLSIIQGPFCVAPCQTLISRFATFSSPYRSYPRASPSLCRRRRRPRSTPRASKASRPKQNAVREDKSPHTAKPTHTHTPTHMHAR